MPMPTLTMLAVNQTGPGTANLVPAGPQGTRILIWRLILTASAPTTVIIQDLGVPATGPMSMVVGTPLYFEDGNPDQPMARALINSDARMNVAAASTVTGTVWYSVQTN